MSQPRKVIIGDCELWLGDCMEVLETLGKVDAVVTSPPYANQRTYLLDEFDWLKVVPNVLAMVNSPDAQIIVNIGIVHKHGKVDRYWDSLISKMESEGWRLFGWYVWDKLNGLPGDHMGRLAPAHEWIFHFNKTPRRPNKWIATKERGPSGKGLRRKNGEMSGLSSPEKCGQPYKISDSVIRTPNEQSRAEAIEHPAVFPVAFARNLISSFSDALDTILDPFMGSGTTGVACVKLGRKFIGIEIEKRYFDIACRRIEEAYKQPDLFIPSPTKAHQESLL